MSKRHFGACSAPFQLVKAGSIASALIGRFVLKPVDLAKKACLWIEANSIFHRSTSAPIIAAKKVDKPIRLSEIAE